MKYKNRPNVRLDIKFRFFDKGMTAKRFFKDKLIEKEFDLYVRYLYACGIKSIELEEKNHITDVGKMAYKDFSVKSKYSNQAPQKEWEKGK